MSFHLMRSDGPHRCVPLYAAEYRKVKDNDLTMFGVQQTRCFLLRTTLQRRRKTRTARCVALA